MAKKSNRYNEELQKFQTKHNQVLESIRQICNPNQQTKEYLLKYFHESEGSKKQIAQPSEANPFVQIIQNKQQELKKQPQNLLFQQTSPVQGFLQNQQPSQIQTSGSFLFTNQQQQTQPKANPFTQLTTGNQTNSNMNTTSQSLNGFNAPKFGDQSANKSSFNLSQTGFFKSTELNQPVSINKPADSNQAVLQVNSNPHVYSDMNEINEHDMNEFNANKFTLGKIPRCPPTKELCF